MFRVPANTKTVAVDRFKTHARVSALPDQGVAAVEQPLLHEGLGSVVGKKTAHGWLP